MTKQSERVSASTERMATADRGSRYEDGHAVPAAVVRGDGVKGVESGEVGVGGNPVVGLGGNEF